MPAAFGGQQGEFLAGFVKAPQFRQQQDPVGANIVDEGRNPGHQHIKQPQRSGLVPQLDGGFSGDGSGTRPRSQVGGGGDLGVERAAQGSEPDVVSSPDGDDVGAAVAGVHRGVGDVHDRDDVGNDSAGHGGRRQREQDREGKHYRSMMP